ncbi:MAG: hypothetical protein R3F37_15200 [Candidatus Competibacteraceae bacterium]
MPEDPVIGNDIILYAEATDPFSAKVNCWLDYKGLEFSIIHVSPLSRREIGFTGQIHIAGAEDRRRMADRFPQMRPLAGRAIP